MPPTFPGRLFTALAALACTLLASCGSGRVKLYPVRGQVFFQGNPAEGALVVFQPADAADPNAPKPSGTASPDGSFTLSTYPHGEGAPAGEYVVLVTWYPPDAREQENAINKLPDRYADPTAALLKATVEEAPNELQPFRLTK